MTSTYGGFFGHVIQAPPLAELRAERSYLFNNLQREDLKATDLLRKVPALEDALTRAQSSASRRRTRKQIGWLRYRINEAARQQRTILNRLSQLAGELESRERWNQIQHEHKQGASTLVSPCAPFYEMHRMSISPLTPRACQEYPFPVVQMPQRQHRVEEMQWRRTFHDSVLQMPSEIFSPVSPRTICFPSRISVVDAQSRVATPECTNYLVRGRRSASMSSIERVPGWRQFPSVAPPMLKSYSAGSTDAIKIWSDSKEDESSWTRDESLEGPWAQYSGYYLDL